MSRLLFAFALLALPAAAASRTLTAQEAVAEALARNPSLLAAVADDESTALSIVVAEGLFVPRLQVEGLANHREAPSIDPSGALVSASDTLEARVGVAKRFDIGTDLSLSLRGASQWSELRTEQGDTSFGPFYTATGRLDLSQPLLRGAGRTVVEAQLRQARAFRDESTAAIEAQASALARDVLVAWSELWYAERAVDIERQSLELAQRQLAEARRRVQLGTQAPVSVYSFETQVATRHEEVAAAERIRRERAVVLAALLGLSAEELQAAGDPAGGGASLLDLHERAEASSPEVRRAEAELQRTRIQSETAADFARARLDLQGFAEVGRVADGFDSLTADEGATAFSAGVNLIYELPLDRREVRAAEGRARLAVVAATRRLEQARIEVQASVDQELARAESARRRVELAQRTVEFAEAQLRAEQARYATGAATAIDVVKAEDDLRDARLRVARAQVDLSNAEASLEHLTGDLLELARRAVGTTG